RSSEPHRSVLGRRTRKDVSDLVQHRLANPLLVVEVHELSRQTNLSVRVDTQTKGLLRSGEASELPPLIDNVVRRVLKKQFLNHLLSILAVHLDSFGVGVADDETTLPQPPTPVKPLFHSLS